MMSSASQRVLVVDEASDGISLDAIKCVLQRFEPRPGDQVMLLAVLRKVRHPLGYHIKVDSSTWIGSSQKIVKKEVERRKEEYAHADEVMEVFKQCESMKIELDIDIRGEATPKEVVLKAASTFKPSWVILNGKMKKDTDYLIARLSCGVSVVRQNNTLGVLRQPETPNLQEQDIPISSEFIGGDEVKQPKAQSPQKQQIHNLGDMTGGDEQPKTQSPQKPLSDLTRGDEREPEIRNCLCSICNDRRPKIGWKRVFTYAELHAATDGFSANNDQSENGFGVVFRGELNGLKITVKQQKNASFQGDDKEFQSMVHGLSEVRHEHLATLLGSCSEGNDRWLVYEYVCNGSLDQHLSRKNHRDPGILLTWDQRMKIAMGVAKGLKYLHDNNIVHQNLRSSNILLTHDYEPLLGDFGLEMTPYEDSDLPSEMRIATTPCLAPEYADSGKVSQKTDCYSFGVILLQLITGLRSTDPSFGKHGIVEWARPFLKEKNYRVLIEHSQINSYDVNRRVIRVVVKCLKRDPNKRISMDQVIHALSYIVEGSSLANNEISMQRSPSPDGMDDLTTVMVPSITAKEYYRTTTAIQL